ncbi:MAG: phosphatase PAP2 family protein [Clostridia bacterium]|nr:phosphatase PAP2 family protein [Clostridia bacterium]
MAYYDKLIKLYGRVYSRPTLVSFMKAVNFGSVWFAIACCLTVGVSLSIDKKITEVLGLLLAILIPLLVISLVSKFFSFSRPYEIIDIEPFIWLREERRDGGAFPSRHVFFAWLVGVIMIPYTLTLGVSVMLTGILLSVNRVALGLHFPKDVIAGGIIGIASGVIGTLVL